MTENLQYDLTYSDGIVNLLEANGDGLGATVTGNRVRLIRAVNQGSDELAAARKTIDKAITDLLYRTAGEMGEEFTYPRMLATGKLDEIYNAINGYIKYLNDIGQEIAQRFATYAVVKGFEETGELLTNVKPDYIQFGEALEPEITFGGGMVNPTAIEYVTNYPVDGKLFRDRFSELTVSSQNKAKKAITGGLTQGKGVREIAKEVKDVTGFDTHVANGIVRDTVMNAQNHANCLAYEEAGIEKIMRVASLCNTCPECIARDREIMDVTESDQIWLHYSCQCVAAPVVEGWPVGSRAGRDYEKSDRGAYTVYPADTTALDWIKKQPPEFQEKIMGYNRMRHIRSGTITWEQNWTKAGNLIDIQKLVPTEPILARDGSVLRGPIE